MNHASWPSSGKKKKKGDGSTKLSFGPHLNIRGLYSNFLLFIKKKKANIWDKSVSGASKQSRPQQSTAFFFAIGKKKDIYSFYLHFCSGESDCMQWKDGEERRSRVATTTAFVFFLGKRVVSADQTETRVTHLRVLGTSGSGEAQQWHHWK